MHAPERVAALLAESAPGRHGGPPSDSLSHSFRGGHLLLEPAALISLHLVHDEFIAVSSAVARADSPETSSGAACGRVSETRSPHLNPPFQRNFQRPSYHPRDGITAWWRA
jgi:hypothetical protein